MIIFSDFWGYRTGRKKPNLEKDLILFKHLNNMVNDITSMFHYENLPETIDKYFMNACLLINGSCGIFKDPKGNVICAQGGDTEDPGIYGFCDKYLATTMNGEYSVTFTKGVDGVALYNNHSRTPDINIITLAEQFTEVETSENRNVLWSRVMPIPYADDTKEQTQIETAIQNTLDGKLATILSSNVNDFQCDLWNRERKPPLQLADIRNIPFLQYLAEYWDVLNRRYYTRYGHALQSTSKHAQVSRDEVNGLNSVSWITPLNMLEERVAGWEVANKIFDTNVQVSFAEPWKTEFTKYLTGTDEVQNKEKENEGGGDNASDNKTE